MEFIAQQGIKQASQNRIDTPVKSHSESYYLKNFIQKL